MDYGRWIGNNIANKSRDQTLLRRNAMKIVIQCNDTLRYLDIARMWTSDYEDGFDFKTISEATCFQLIHKLHNTRVLEIPKEEELCRCVVERQS